MIKKLILVILGIILSLVLLECGLRLIGFTISSYQQYKNNKVLKSKSQYTIMCLGESTTARQYPVQLQEILNKTYPNKFSIIDCGIPGTKLENILELIDNNINKYKPNITICMMGINNGFVINNATYMEQNKKFITFKKHLKVYNLFLLLKTHLQSLFKDNLVFANNDIATQKSLENLALEYYKCADYEKSIELSKKILQVEPLNDMALYLLATIYFYHIKDEKESYRLANIAIDNNISSDRSSFYYMAILYCIRNNISFDNLLEKLLNDKFELEFTNSNILSLYRLVKPYLTKEQLDRFTKLIPTTNDTSYGFLPINAIEQKEYQKAKEYFDKIEEIRRNFPNIETYNLYKLIIKKLIDNNIKVICMQYPVRSILSLKEQLKDETYYDKLTFISNEKIFKNALIEKNYDEIFQDQFAGDFGHCTNLGNTMIAENVVKTLEDILNLKQN